ncbi:MAG TPA: SHOCT domain-containing protein [Mucilaginibacter sp.]|jgi:NADH:ubiquinone oxidoreductase subunit 6 (subunit J)
MDFATLNKQRKFTLIAAVVGVISIFLPWIAVSGFGVSISENGLHSYGVMAFIGFIGAGVVAITSDQTKPLDKAMWFVELIAGAIALIFTLIFMTSLSGGESLVGGYGIGIWISMLASIGVLASAWLLKSPEDNLQDSFEILKTKVTNAAGSNASGTSSTTGTSKVDDLERLIKLREEGKISEEEYTALKAKIL